MADVDIPTGKKSQLLELQREQYIQYQINISISFKDAPKPIDEKPLVYIKDAEFIGDLSNWDNCKGTS